MYLVKNNIYGIVNPVQYIECQFCGEYDSPKIIDILKLYK